MKLFSKYKVDKSLLFMMLLFCIISITTIYSAEVLSGDTSFLYIKQFLWYIAGFIVVIFIMTLGNHVLIKKVFFFISSEIFFLYFYLFLQDQLMMPNVGLK